MRIPPLRERGGDALLLANYSSRRASTGSSARNIRGFTEAANAALAAHALAGQRARAGKSHEARGGDDRETDDRRGGPRTGARGACGGAARSAGGRLRAEREVLQLALARANGTLSVAAKLLGVSRPTLYGLMEVHGIELEPGKVAGAGAEPDETRPSLELRFSIACACSNSAGFC